METSDLKSYKPSTLESGAIMGLSCLFGDATPATGRHHHIIQHILECEQECCSDGALGDLGSNTLNKVSMWPIDVSRSNAYPCRAPSSPLLG